MPGYIVNLINMVKGLNGFLCYGAVILFGAGIATSSVMAAANSKDPAQRIVEQNCGACHGLHGNSLIPVYPKLAAQVPQYLTKQLHDFASGARTSSIMFGIAKALSDTQIQELAQYFSQQVNKTTVRPDRQLAAQGKKIYHGGVFATHLPACEACHGLTAIGLPPRYPRLAGQNSPYIESQLLAFRNKKRNNDAHAVMRDIAGKLTTQKIKAVTAYLSSLR